MTRLAILAAMFCVLPAPQLFLGWSQGRNQPTEDGQLRIGDDLGELFREPSENVLMLKVRYWITP